MPANTPWAVLVYMVADELQLPAAHADIVEMQRAGSSSAVGIGLQIQIRQDAGFKRFVVQARQSKPSDPSKEWPLASLQAQKGTISNKVGSSKTLEDFLLWGLDELPAENYLLVLWGHSFGFGFGRLKTAGSPSKSDGLSKLFNFSHAGGRLSRSKADESTPAAGPDAPATDASGPQINQAAQDDDGLLDLDEIGKALDAFKAARPQPKILEILGHNTCNTSKAEIALALAGKARFLVASQLAIPLFTGWPFKDVVNQIVCAARKRPITPEELSIAIVDVFAKSYKPKIVALSALDLSKADLIRADITDLSAALLAAMNDTGDGPRNQAIIARGFMMARLETASLMPREASEPAVDFYGLCAAVKDSIELKVPAAQRGKLNDVVSIIDRIAPHRDAFVVESDVEGGASEDGGKDASEELSGFLVLAPGLRQEDAIDVELQEWIHWPRGWYDTGWPDVIAKVAPVTRALPLPAAAIEQEDECAPA